MPENSTSRTTAEAVAKMHVTHVEQAQGIGISDALDAFYDRVEDLPTDRLVALSTTLTAQVRQTTERVLSADDEPTSAQMFAALFQSSTVLSVHAFVNLVLLSRFVADPDALKAETFEDDFAAASDVASAMEDAVIDAHAGTNEHHEEHLARFNELVAQGVPLGQAASQAVDEVETKYADEAPKATAGGVDIPTGFYL